MLGMVWAPDTAERDDGPQLLEVFGAVLPHTLPGCKDTHRFMMLLIIVGDCESIIKYGAGCRLTLALSDAWSDHLLAKQYICTR